MNIFLTYIFEVNVIITLFGLSYYVLFRNESFHRVNRAVILSSILISFLIPLISFSTPQAFTQVVNFDPVLISAQSTLGHNESGYNFPSVLQMLYWLGFTLSFFFVIRRFLLLMSIRGQESDSVWKGIRIVRTRKLKAPASFFKTIYLTPDISQESEESILAHEYAHIREKHSIDLLFMQIVQIFCWFNPVIYRLRNLLEATHEYRADEIASAQKDKTIYSNLLISYALKINPKILAHQFSKSNQLKQRIMMLHKPNNRRVSIIKYFLLIPIITGALFLNACTDENSDKQSEEATPTENMNKIKGTDIFTKADKMPVYPGGDDALMKYLSENIEYPPACKEEGVEGTVYLSFVVDKSGELTDMKVLKSPDERLSANAMDVLSKMPAWTPGENAGKLVKVQYNLPIKYQLR